MLKIVAVVVNMVVNHPLTIQWCLGWVCRPIRSSLVPELSVNQRQRGKSHFVPLIPSVPPIIFLFSRAHPLSYPFHNKLCGRKWPCNFEVQAKNCTLTGCCQVYFCFVIGCWILDLSLITIQIGFVPSPTLRVIESVLQCFLICLCMLFRVLLWPGGEDRWGGWANFLWRRGCYSERTETIAECQDLKIQSPQRCKGSVTARASIRVCSASLYIWCIFILNSFCITTSRVYFEHMYNCIIFIILPPGSLWIPED